MVGSGGIHLAGAIEAALGGDLAAIFRHEADIVRQDLQRDLQNLAGIAHFQIELGGDAFLEAENVPVQHVPAILAQMGGNAVGSSALSDQGGGDRIGLGIGGIGLLRENGPAAGWRRGRYLLREKS